MNNKELLDKLANTNTCNDQENIAFENVLKLVGFPDARVTCGITYLVGRGTIEFPPMDIHNAAKMILKILLKNNIIKEA